MKKLFFSAVALLAMAPVFAQNWALDKSHAKLGFTVTHLMISEVDGNFKTFDVKITSAKDDFTDAVIELTADVNTISTDNERRDGHLKSPDFFDTAKFGSLAFKSTSIAKADGKKYKVVGDLTMHGVTKPVTLEVTLNGTTINQRSQKKMAGFKAAGTIKRSDFAVGTTPVAVVSDEVELKFNGEFVKD